ncbi:MAG: 50S ribosomal protein L23 [Spirochaetia bacterium]|jgi:large subunit ribosomal protein L23
MTLDRIIIEPVVTEKTNIMRESHKYVFRVDSRANKHQIMDAVRRQYNVHPLKCNVLRTSTKPKRVRYRLGYTSSWKKAIITISPEEKIGIFEGA